jgi:hypothetical protein
MASPQLTVTKRDPIADAACRLDKSEQRILSLACEHGSLVQTSARHSLHLWSLGLITTNGLRLSFWCQPPAWTITPTFFGRKVNRFLLRARAA